MSFSRAFAMALAMFAFDSAPDIMKGLGGAGGVGAFDIENLQPFLCVSFQQAIAHAIVMLE